MFQRQYQCNYLGDLPCCNKQAALHRCSTAARTQAGALAWHVVYPKTRQTSRCQSFAW